MDAFLKRLGCLVIGMIMTIIFLSHRDVQHDSKSTAAKIIMWLLYLADSVFLYILIYNFFGIWGE